MYGEMDFGQIHRFTNMRATDTLMYMGFPVYIYGYFLSLIYLL